MSNLNNLYSNAGLIMSDDRVVSGEVTWQSPSNIALIKYWGKHGKQLPMNPSVSFTLSKSFTETTVKYRNSASGFKFIFFLEGNRKPAFEDKLNTFFNNVIDIFPFLNYLEIEINSKNTFPHSSGIASSASGMSALSLCLCSIEKKLFNLDLGTDEFLRKASYVSRIGSGSASRSVFGKLSSWGKSESVPLSSDYYSTNLSNVLNPVFSNYQDSIILINAAEKKVSSTKGHDLMKNHPFANARFAQANKNFSDIIEVIKRADLNKFSTIVENEAMSLHAMMMTSNPGFFLLEPDSLKLIQSVISFRERTKLPICFTLDAGPNVHLLYPDNHKVRIREFIEKELLGYSKDREIIYDHLGDGPIMINEN